MSLPLWFQVSTFAVLGVLLVTDLAVVARRPHVPSIRECALWVAGYVTLALAFAVVLYAVSGGEVAGEFVAGWLTEYSLSVDNLFVFVLIMSRFAVPRGNQQMVLMMGIILSLVLRGACIVVGAAAIERFSWVFYLFGAFLVYTALQLLRGSDDGEEYEENGLIRQARRLLPIADDFDGARLFTRNGTRNGSPKGGRDGARGGTRMLTPMMIVFLAIGSTDLLFALDSIPAIFGLTQDPFVVFTATLFALMGLRQLYFLLGGLLDRLVYLSLGLSLILGFIGVKLILEALHTNELEFLNGGRPVEWAPAIPTVVSLGVIVVVLAVTTGASLLRSSWEASRATPPVPVPAAAPARPDRLDAPRPAPSRTEPHPELRSEFTTGRTPPRPARPVQSHGGRQRLGAVPAPLEHPHEGAHPGQPRD